MKRMPYSESKTKYSTLILLLFVLLPYYVKGSFRGSFQTGERPSRWICAATTKHGGETPQRNIASLETWSEQQGIIRADGLQLKQEKSVEGTMDVEDYSVRLSKPMKQNEVLLHVPKSVIFSSVRIRNELEGLCSSNLPTVLDYLNEACKMDIDTKFLLWVKLLKEYEQGSDSIWHPWVQSLPKSFGTALAMDEVELQCLPPHAYSLAELLRLHYSVFSEALNRLDCKNVFRNSTAIQQDKNLQEWAFNSVFSRCWGSEELGSDHDRDLVPMGDMFNHGEPANVMVTYDEHQNCNIILQNDVPANTPLTLNYGRATTPAKFLTVFGFVDTTTPHLFSQIMCSKPTQRHIDMGYDIDKMVFSTQTNHHKEPLIAPAVWDVLLFNLLEQLPSEQEIFYQAHVQGDASTKKGFHKKYQLEISILLKQHVDSTLRELEPLLDILSQLDSSKHSNIPMIFQHNLLIYNTFKNVQQHVNSIIQISMKERQQASK